MGENGPMRYWHWTERSNTKAVHLSINCTIVYYHNYADCYYSYCYNNHNNLTLE